MGRAAWAASALPLEGALASLPTASDAARREVFTCLVSDPIEGMTDFMDPQGQDDCIALNEHGIVMGRTRRRVVEASSVGATVEEIMEIGPTTVRPDEPLAALVGRMRRRGVQSIVVATLDGRLVGVLYRDEAESLLGIDASAIERE